MPRRWIALPGSGEGVWGPPPAPAASSGSASRTGDRPNNRPDNGPVVRRPPRRGDIRLPGPGEGIWAAPLPAPETPPVRPMEGALNIAREAREAARIGRAMARTAVELGGWLADFERDPESDAGDLMPGFDAVAERVRTDLGRGLDGLAREVFEDRMQETVHRARAKAERRALRKTVAQNRRHLDETLADLGRLAAMAEDDDEFTFASRQAEAAIRAQLAGGVIDEAGAEAARERFQAATAAMPGELPRGEIGTDGLINDGGDDQSAAVRQAGLQSGGDAGNPGALPRLPGVVTVHALATGRFGAFVDGELLAEASTAAEARAKAGAALGGPTPGVIVFDLLLGLTELPVQVAGGLFDALSEFALAGDSLANYLNENVVDLTHPGTGIDAIDNPLAFAANTLPTVPRGESVSAGIARGLTQFIVGFLVSGVALKGVRPVSWIGRRGKASVQAALTEAFFFDPHEENLAALLRKHAGLHDPITAFLAVDKDDNEAEARLKRALGGLVEGPVFDGLVRALKFLRAARRVRTEGTAVIRRVEDLEGIPSPELELPSDVAARIKAFQVEIDKYRTIRSHFAEDPTEAARLQSIQRSLQVRVNAKVGRVYETIVFRFLEQVVPGFSSRKLRFRTAVGDTVFDGEFREEGQLIAVLEAKSGPSVLRKQDIAQKQVMSDEGIARVFVQKGKPIRIDRPGRTRTETRELADKEELGRPNDD